MLSIVVDIIPSGYDPLRRTVASMTIANVASLADLSDYAVEAIESKNDIAGLPARRMSVRVEDHDRRQSVWCLVAKAAAAVAAREGDPL